MAETTFEMTPTTLARAIANGARRERNRAVMTLLSRAAVLLAAGKVEMAQELEVQAEAIRSGQGPATGIVDAPAPVAAEPIAEPVDPDELPPVHHSDDFSDGVALVQGAAHRRLVTGYQGASGHLRD